MTDNITPAHYQSEYQWKDFARKMCLYGNFFNFKYLVRAGKKQGSSEIEDLNKFKQYINYEIEYIESLQVPFVKYTRPDMDYESALKEVNKFANINNIHGNKFLILIKIIQCIYADDNRIGIISNRLGIILDEINLLIFAAQRKEKK